MTDLHELMREFEESQHLRAGFLKLMKRFNEYPPQVSYAVWTVRKVGTATSGFHGHAGRPGIRGGSVARGGAKPTLAEMYRISGGSPNVGGTFPPQVAYYKLKNEWARVNKQLFEEVRAGRADSTKAHDYIDQMKGIVKAMYRLDVDPGGVALGLPGGSRDVVIVGAGPGGMSAAINAGAEGLDTLMVEADVKPGGQSKYSSRIENYPGFPAGVTGDQLASLMHDQALRVGSDERLGVRVTGLRYDPDTGMKTVTLSNGEQVKTKTVILAGGIEFMKASFPGSDSPNVIYADSQAVSRQGAGKNVVIAGGSNGAAQAALLAAEGAEHTTLISRSPITKAMSDYQRSALRAQPENISILEGKQITGLQGNDMSLSDGSKIKADVVGVFFGGKTNTNWLPPEVKLAQQHDEQGRVVESKVKVDANMETSVPGVYAIGDMRDTEAAGAGGRIGVAVGDGQQTVHNLFGYFDKMKHTEEAAQQLEGWKTHVAEELARRRAKGPGTARYETELAKFGPKRLPPEEWDRLMDGVFELDKQNPYLSTMIEDEHSSPPWQRNLEAEWNAMVQPRGIFKGDEAVWAVKGGQGSGNFEHAGRPGQVGGSAPSKGPAKGAPWVGRAGARPVAGEIGAPSSAYPKLHSGAVDTQHAFSDAPAEWTVGQKPNEYTPERTALHQDIVDHFMGEARSVDNPVTYFMGGGTASGKSTVIKEGHVGIPPNTPISNSDKVKELLPEYEERRLAGQRDASIYVHNESSDVADQVTARAMREHTNLVVDGTGDSNYESLASKVRSLKASGMRVVANYVTVDTEAAVARSKARAQKPGEDFGREVPETVVRKLHENVSTVLPKAMREGLFDQATLWDTNDHGKPPLKVASAAGGKVTIHDQKAWDRFLAKAPRQ